MIYLFAAQLILFCFAIAYAGRLFINLLINKQ